MFKKSFSLTLIVSLFAEIQAQKVVKHCQNVDYVKDFDATKFKGKWLEFAATIRPTKNWECVWFDFDEYNEPYLPYTVHYYDKRKKQIKFDKNKVINNEGHGINDDGDEWYLVGTDYKTFAVIYACLKNETTTSEIVHILITEASDGREFSGISRAAYKANLDIRTDVVMTYEGDHCDL